MATYDSYAARALSEFLGGTQPRESGQDGSVIGRRAVPVVDTQPLYIPKTIGLSMGAEVTPVPVRAPISVTGYEHKAQAIDWFEKVHVIPPSGYELGNILSTTDKIIDVYNSYRATFRSWTSFSSPFDSSIAFLSLPTFPFSLSPQKGTAITMRVYVTGPPSFSNSLSFVFDIGTYLVPVSGTRVVIVPYRPEVPLKENLQFLTDVIVAASGKEQRIALRAYPRSEYEVSYVRKDAIERAQIENLLFGWQGRVFGLPLWHQGTTLSSSISTGALTMNVGSTAYAEFRNNGIGVVIQDDFTYEAFEIQSFTGTVITLKNAFQGNFSAKSEVYPIRLCDMPTGQSGSRLAYGIGKFSLKLRGTDNRYDASSTAGFGTFNSKVLVDDPNYTSGEQPTQYYQAGVSLDNKTSFPVFLPSWDHGKRVVQKGWITRTRQRAWEIRQLLYALRGRQVSFYLPSFQKDFELQQDIGSSATVIRVANTGYSRYVNTSPNSALRIITKAGTIYARSITGATAISNTQEDIDISSSLGVGVTIAEIERIELLQLVRFDSDTITLQHLGSNGEMVIEAPVRSSNN